MRFVLPLALLYAGMFGAIGVQLAFLPLWFAAKGLDEAMIGAVFAVATALRVLTLPLITRAADRFVSPKRAVTLVVGAGALCLTALGMADAAAAILFWYALAACAGGAAISLTESYALCGLAERGAAYGPVRLWGSVAFIIAAMGTGTLQPHMAPVELIWLLAGSYWLALAAAASLRSIEADAPPGATGAGAFGLLRDPAMLAVFAGSACIQASHALLYGFGTLQWTAAGIDGTTIGVLWSLGVVAEIVLFAASARFPPAVGPALLLGLGAAGAVLRWAAMAFAPPTGLLLALQCLHALSFGATHLGAVQFIARAAPPGLAASAQGWLAAANGAAMAGAMALSGLLHARYGSAAYLAMAMLAAAGALTVLPRLRRAEAP